MTNIETIQRIPLFADLPEEHHAWLAEQAIEIHLNEGDALFKQGKQVELHQGDIYFTSQPGNTRFYVRLPIDNDVSDVSVRDSISMAELME